MKTTFFSSSVSYKFFAALMIIMLALAAMPATSAYAADTNLQSPTQDVATAAGDGNGFELNPTNAYADGGGVASNINGAGDQHIYYGYDLSAIPAGDIVDGIEVRLDWYLDNVLSTNSMSVELSWDGGTTWTTAQSTTPTEPIVEATTTLGGPANNWGHTWSVTASNATNELSSTNFRVRVNSVSPSTFRDFFLDWVPVRVYSRTPPEIDIQGNAISILDGDITPAVADDTEFGSAGLGSTVDHTFTIFNTGPSTLNLSNATLTGSTSFLIQTPPAASVPSGGSTTFVIRFAPNATGVSNSKTATFSVDNDDQDENPYTFDVHGTRLMNEMNVQGNANIIADGDVTPSLPDGTNWGNVGVGVIVDRIFTINNTGTANLTIGAITFVGGNAADFSMVSAPTSPIFPGGSTTFTARLTAGAAGVRSTTINIANDDSDENPYDFMIQGNGVTTIPEIEVLRNGITITDGDITPRTVDGTDFGSGSVGSTISITYTIKNNGAINLTIGAFTFTGDFSLATAPITPVAAGASTTFQVNFSPTATGVRNGTVSFVNNDTTENPYNFSLTGTGTNIVPIITSDGGGATATINLTENTTAVTTVTATDPNVPSQTLTYSISGTDAGAFSINPASGVLTFSPAPNFESPSDADTNNSYIVDVQVSDGVSTDTQTITVNVADINEPPTNITLSPTAIAENNAVNDVIGALSTIDADAGNTFTYSLTCATPGADDASFNISGANLQAGAVFDFETQSSYFICIRTTDQGSLFFDKNFTISVTDIDEIPPTVTITSTAADPTNVSPIPVTITFSEAVTGFFVGDVNVGNGTAGNFNTSDNITFTLDIAPTVSGLVTVDVAANVAQDAAGNNNTAATQFSIIYDNIVPTVTITSTATDPTSTSPIPVTITFSEAVTGFVVGDIAVGNGTAGGFSTSDNITFTINITPASAGLVTVDVAAGVARDAAGNDNTAATQFSITYDNSAPTVTITSTAIDPTNMSPIPVTITFSEAVTGFVVGDITVGNGTAGNFNTSDNITFTVDITPTVDGLVTVDVAAGVAQDSAGNDNTAATQFSITYDKTAPTVLITSTAANPTNVSPIPVTITFSEAVTGFVVGDITVGNGSAGNFAGSGTTYTVDITPTTNGLVTVDVAVNVAQDSSGNNNTAAVQFSITYDDTLPAVTVEQAVGQLDPTNTSPINFTITFSKPIDIATFIAGDLTLGGTVPGTLTAVLTEVAPNDGTTFNSAVSGMTGNGTVTASIAVNMVQDPLGNNNTASLSIDNIVTYDTVNPAVVSTDLVINYTGTGPANFIATFSKPVADPAGNTGVDDVTNPANYLLVNKGINGVADTASCAGGVKTDDIKVAVNSVSYNNVTFTSTVTFASALPAGSYRLFICGTTSIVDLAGNPLNGGTDYTFDFVVQAVVQPPAALPATGFPQNEVTSLPLQPAEKAYASTDLWLEIPKLGVKMSIIGVPQTSDGWDVKWLNKDAGWLNGSAFPTWSGNSVLTGHVWDALNKPGPFAGLKSLKYGDQIRIHAFGQVYTYEIRESKTTSSTSVSTVFKHEENSWITLITCEDYQEQSKTYTYRRVVRAVLVSIDDNK